MAMAVVQTMPIKSIWKELADTFLEAVSLQEYLSPASIQIIIDTYDNKRDNTNIMGHFRSDSFISNEGQTIPQNTNDWNNFIYNAENKIELTNFFLRYFFLNIFTFFKTTFH